MTYLHPPVTSHEKFRVLVVEGDAHIARPILASLANAGMQCRYAGDGEAALTSFREREPHLVVIDLTTPGLNGFALCRRIRRIRNVPIIMMTGADDILSQLHALNVGADNIAPKPIDCRILVAQVSAHLRRAYHYDSPQEPSVFY